MNTKNIYLLGLGLFAAVAFSSCDKIEESLAKPIENPQLPIFDNATVVYIPVTDINVSNPEVGFVKIADVTAEGLPEGYVFSGTLELSPTQDFADMIEVPLTCPSGNELVANAAQAANLYSQRFTYDPAQVTLFGRTILCAENGSDKVRIGSYDTYYGEGSYLFSPAAADHIITPSYYVVMGNGSTWDYAGAVKLENSGKNPYDDPKFTAIVGNTPAAGNYWFVLNEVNYNAVVGGQALAGTEYYVPMYDRADKGVTYGSLELQTSGNFDTATMPAMGVPCELTVDAKTLTYTSSPAIEAYYATGDGWSNWGNHWMKLSTTNYKDYQGFLNLNNEFKISPIEGWDGSFSASEPLNGTEENGIYTFSGTVNDSDDGNIKLGHPGLYFATLNVTKWNLTLNEIKSWGITGDFNGWSDNDVEMTPSADLYVWTAELTVAAGQKWKFRANKAWDVNLGGEPDELWYNGDNIDLPEDGTYTITLDLSTYPAKYTAVKK